MLSAAPTPQRHAQRSPSLAKYQSYDMFHARSVSVVLFYAFFREEMMRQGFYANPRAKNARKKRKNSRQEKAFMLYCMR